MLLSDERIDAPFDPAAELFEDALGRGQLQAVGWKADPSSW